MKKQFFQQVILFISLISCREFVKGAFIEILQWSPPHSVGIMSLLYTIKHKAMHYQIIFHFPLNTNIAWGFNVLSVANILIFAVKY